jgi:SpoVK/Ycf46/Vps4 family AAA+-type ATPase
MKYLLEFLSSDDLQSSEIFTHLKCEVDEAKILQYMVKNYLKGAEEIGVVMILSDIFDTKEYQHINKLSHIRNLLDLGWITHNSFNTIRVSDVSNLELLNTNVTLSVACLKLLEEGNIELVLPEISPYLDHLDYLKDQFFRIELYQKIESVKHNVTKNSPNISRLRNKLNLLESRIEERIKATQRELEVEELFEEHELNEKEQIIFLALLKEEYTHESENLREMNVLIDLVSFDDYERIKNRGLLEDSAKLIDCGIIDYDEILTAFGGISRSFFISDEILQTIIHPNKEQKKEKLKLDIVIKEQDIFELIEPETVIDDVVLHPKTKEIIDNLLQQMDERVVKRLKEWGIKKSDTLDAKIILHGPAGTGKTMTAHSLAKSLGKSIVSLDSSKILSMYVGESEKNVRKIFDTYNDISANSKIQPILLLNEADQFLSYRSTSPTGSADKMHNQMQNIFLEQIENFKGILIATTNLLETIDPAFSRRFEYKIEFKKPDFDQRIELWKKLLPVNAPYSDDFDPKILSKYALTGGQIALIIKNSAMRVALKTEPLFTHEEFFVEIERELGGAFGESKSMGFMQ